MTLTASSSVFIARPTFGCPSVVKTSAQKCVKKPVFLENSGKFWIIRAKKTKNLKLNPTISNHDMLKAVLFQSGGNSRAARIRPSEVEGVKERGKVYILLSASSVAARYAGGARGRCVTVCHHLLAVFIARLTFGCPSVVKNPSESNLIRLNQTDGAPRNFCLSSIPL